MRYFQNFDKIYFLLVFPVLRMVWPILQYRFKGIVIVPFAIIWFLYVFFAGRARYMRSTYLRTLFLCIILFLGIYLLLPLIYGFSGEGDRMSWRPMVAACRFVEALFMLSIVHHSLMMGRIRELKLILCLVFLSYIWMGFASVFVGSRFAEIGTARLAVAHSLNSSNNMQINYDFSDVASAGIGATQSVYVSAFIIPLFLYSFFFVKGKIKKALCIFLAWCAYVNIKYGGINTPFMIMTVGIVLAALAKFYRLKRSLVVVGCCLAIFMLAFSYNPKMLSFMASPLRALGESTIDTLPQLSMRCCSMADAVEGHKDSYAATRYQLQVESFEGFLSNNILFGAVGPAARLKSGGHSEFLDCLAYYGLVGASVIVLFLFFFLKYCNLLAKQGLGYKWLPIAYVYVGTWIFASIPNPVILGAPELLLLVPGIAVFYRDFEERFYLR